MMPVCGKDGKTYNNACLAKCAGVEVTANGRCKQKPGSGSGSGKRPGSGSGSGKRPGSGSGKKPGPTKRPVVGSHYCTYGPDKACFKTGWPSCCHSDRSGSKCPKVRPGCDVVVTRRPSVTLATKPKACVCPMVMMPVCGKDGKTYNNACLAKCAGVEVAANGPCKQKPGSG